MTPRNTSKQRSRRAIDLQAAIIAAAERIGADGHGRDGLVGYLMRVADKYPQQYASLMGRVLPLPRVQQDTNYGYDVKKLDDDELMVFERLVSKIQVIVPNEDEPS